MRGTIRSDQSQTSDDKSELCSTEDKDAVGPAGFTEFLKSWVVESLQSVLKHPKSTISISL